MDNKKGTTSPASKHKIQLNKKNKTKTTTNDKEQNRHEQTHKTTKVQNRHEQTHKIQYNKNKTHYARQKQITDAEYKRNTSKRYT